jgi:hypothetical protein
MLTKITIALCVFFVVAAASGVAVQAQTAPSSSLQPVKPLPKPFTEFERMWFKMPVGGAE